MLVEAKSIPFFKKVTMKKNTYSLLLIFSFFLGFKAQEKGVKPKKWPGK